MAVTFLTNEDKKEMILNTPQTLTEEQKAQARENIGAQSKDTVLIVTVEDGVASHTPAQILEYLQKGGSGVYLEVNGGYNLIPLSNIYFENGCFEDWTATFYEVDMESQYVYRYMIWSDGTIEGIEFPRGPLIVALDGHGTASHTSLEIKNALDANRQVYLDNDGDVLVALQTISTDGYGARFVMSGEDWTSVYTIDQDGNVL